MQFAYDLLREEHVLVVQGTGFNWPEPDHFRIVYLPMMTTLTEAMDKLEHFLDGYTQGT
jgi:alanine-synthesizing transaminase